MKTLPIAAIALLLLVHSLAADPKPKQDRRAQEKCGERLVFVTGSLIPQRIKLEPFGMTTVSPVRIIDRHEIDGTGRVTIPGAFANEPSVQIRGR